MIDTSQPTLPIRRQDAAEACRLLAAATQLLIAMRDSLTGIQHAIDLAACLLPLNPDEPHLTPEDMTVIADDVREDNAEAAEDVTAMVAPLFKLRELLEAGRPLEQGE